MFILSLDKGNKTLVMKSLIDGETRTWKATKDNDIDIETSNGAYIIIEEDDNGNTVDLIGKFPIANTVILYNDEPKKVPISRKMYRKIRRY